MERMIMNLNENVNVDNEIWKPVAGYEGLYEVSNLGRVKSLLHNNEWILRPIDNGHGYLRVALSKNGNVKRYRIHRLVARAFVPNDDPENKTHVNHRNELKADNRASNLEWCNQHYNNNYGTRNKRISKQRSKPIKQIDVAGNVIRIWESTVTAAKHLNHSSNTICNCLHGRLRTAFGFRWEYADK